MEEKKALPDGIEWPCFEDETPVRFGDMGLDVHGRPRPVMSVKFTQAGFTFIGDDMGGTWWDNGTGPMEDVEVDHGKRVKRPAPKVLDADGVEICVGDTVWATNGHGPFEVTRTVYADRLRVICDDEKNGHLNVFPESITHRAPVLAADGKPLCEGEHVWHVETGAELVVKELPKPGAYQAVVVFAPPASHLTSFDPGQLTHERPESKCRDCAHWQKDPTADNMGVCWFFYHEYEGQDCYAARRGDIGACEEFMPRAKALAERDA